MAEEGKNLGLVILGIVAIIAIVGLVLLLAGGKKTTGNLVTMTGCDSPSTPVLAPPGGNPLFLERWVAAGYSCVKASGDDEYGMESWCCTPPYNVPVQERYPGVPILPD